MNIKDIEQAITKLSQWIKDNRVNILNIIDAIEKFPEFTKEAMDIAQKNGWYFGWYNFLDLGELLEISQSIIKNEEEIDNIMANFYTKNISLISHRLIELHPERKSVIEAAVSAHEENNNYGYFLSIPVFIAQSDGLLTKALKHDMILSKKGKKIIHDIIENTPNEDELETSLEILLYPLTKIHDSQFLYSKSDRSEHTNFHALNRHQVMHGEIYDYGKEKNSLKAFSLLSFIGISLFEIIEYKNIIYPN